MKYMPGLARLSLLIWLVIGVASCSDGTQEGSQAKGESKQGVAAQKNQTEVAQLSPGAQLYRAKNCHTCHGDDGNKPLLPNYPVIARQGEAYALQQMLDIQSGSRVNGQSAVMKVLVQDISAADLATLAAYVATELGEVPPPDSGVLDENSAGAQLYKARTCVACHGKDAKTPLLDTYPRIAGHTAEYALQQMTDIKEGKRANNMAVKGMQGIMHLVSEEEMVLLADYIASLPR